MFLGVIGLFGIVDCIVLLLIWNAMYYLDRLDFNIAYACNLSCKGCISLSDFDRKGVEPLDSLLKQINQFFQN